MTGFDATAEQYDRFRALPDRVPEAIREALWAAVPSGPRVGLLDVGVGTGRLGLAFLAAGDSYLGADSSRAMLDRFAVKAADRSLPRPRLVQADGRMLPFADSTFGVALLVQVLSGVSEWARLLAETRRVVRPGGALVLGQTIRPSGGLDDRMRGRLAEILREAGVDARPPGASLEAARGQLAGDSGPATSFVAARWTAPRSPRDFLERKAFGSRFVALPHSIRVESLGRLADWAVATFGSLDAESMDPFRFELDVYLS